MVSRRTSVRIAIAVLAVGAAVIALGTVMIEGARYLAHQMYPISPAIDGIFSYNTWNESQLATGIVLALVGTASVAASLTYLLLDRKRKGV